MENIINSNSTTSTVKFLDIYNRAMKANDNDALIAASHLVQTLQDFPDLRAGDDVIEALAGLLREALAQQNVRKQGPRG